MSLKGGDKHLRRLRKLSGEAVVRIGGAIVYEGADTIRAEAFRGISAGSVSGANHVASAPGDYPNRDTGNLQAHLKAQRTGPLEAEVRSEADYAAFLEFGTSRMAARPHIRPARDAKADQIRRKFADSIDKLVRAAGD